MGDVTTQQIAAEISSTLKNTRSLLQKLCKSGYIEKTGEDLWRITADGQLVRGACEFCGGPLEPETRPFRFGVQIAPDGRHRKVVAHDECIPAENGDAHRG